MQNLSHFLFGIFGGFAPFISMPFFSTVPLFLILLFLVEGNARALFLFSSPAITFWRITKDKSTQKFSGIPYVMTLLNCLLSAWYGLPFVSSDNLLVTTINATGVGIETVYVVMFIVFAPRKEKAKIIGLLAFVLTVFCVVVVVSLFVLHHYSRKFFCGLAAAICSIAMYTSPLSIMRVVIKTKSVEFMPFFLSLFMFLCASSWFVYGLLGHDLFVAVPNGVGSALGATQLVLYFIYRNNEGSPKTHEEVELESSNTILNQREPQDPMPTSRDIGSNDLHWSNTTLIAVDEIVMEMGEPKPAGALSISNGNANHTPLTRVSPRTPTRARTRNSLLFKF